MEDDDEVGMSWEVRSEEANGDDEWNVEMDGGGWRRGFIGGRWRDRRCRDEGLVVTMVVS